MTRSLLIAATLCAALPALAQTSTVQIVDNAAALDAYDPIEIYVNGATTPNAVFGYPDATDIGVTVPANQTLSVRARFVTQPANPLIPREATLTGTIPEGCFKVTLTGIPPQVIAFFAANPDGISTALRTITAPVPCNSTRPAGGSMVDVGVFVVNAVTDSPSIRVVERASGQTVASSVPFGEASVPVAFPAGVLTFDVFRASNGAPLRSFTLDLTSQAGQVVQLSYAGFANPSANQNGPAAGVVGVDATGTAIPSSGGPVATEGGTVAAQLALLQTYPNPVSGQAGIAYTLPLAAPVRLSVADALGREVAVLVDGLADAGVHEAAFDAARLPAGLYIVRLASGADVRTGRLTVVH